MMVKELDRQIDTSGNENDTSDETDSEVNTITFTDPHPFLGLSSKVKI